MSCLEHTYNHKQSVYTHICTCRYKHRLPVLKLESQFAREKKQKNYNKKTKTNTKPNQTKQQLILEAST